MGLWLGWTTLALGWLPFTCGVVSSRAVARSGAADIIRNHVYAGAAFMAVGMLASAACCFIFARAASVPSVIVAATSLAAQVCFFLCVGGIGG